MFFTLSFTKLYDQLHALITNKFEFEFGVDEIVFFVFDIRKLLTSFKSSEITELNFEFPINSYYFYFVYMITEDL